MNNTVKKIFPYELLWIFLGILSVTSVFLISFSWFTPLLSLSISIVLFVTICFFIRKQILLKDNRWGFVILLILLLALVLRLQPWPYLEGGQDEGVYMALSSQFDTSKSLKFEDISEKYLNPKLKELYENEKGWSVLGIKKDLETSKLYFDFYPLHPLLMSITGSIFGDQFRVYSLTLFSILSISGAYLLASELAKNKKAGYIAAGILTVMPLHLYFSRFPVTEIIALAITLNFLYFLLIAYKGKNYIPLFISILLVNMFLYLRLTWVVALPFCILVLLAMLLFSKVKNEKKAWSIWGFLLYFSYGLSLLFYYINYNVIFEHFYGKIFKYIPELVFYTIIALLPVILFILVKYFKSFLVKIFVFLYKNRIILISLSIILVGIYAAYLFYQVAFTTKYLHTPLDWTWGMANAGWYTIKDQIPVSIVLHLTPFAALSLLLFGKKIDSPERVLLFIFAFLFLAFNIVVVRFTPYQLYYARYQISEIIPIAVIFSSLFLFEIFNKRKVLSIVFLSLIFGYNIFFSIYQFQGYVGTTPKFFNKLSETVSKSDFVIYYDPSDWSKSFLFSPLKYYYNFPAIQTKNHTSLQRYVKEIDNTRVFVISTVEIKEKDFVYLKTIGYERGFYANAIESNPPLSWKVNDNAIPFCTSVIPYKYCGGLIPLKYHLGSIDIWVYEYVKSTK